MNTYSSKSAVSTNTWYEPFEQPSIHVDCWSVLFVNNKPLAYLKYLLFRSIDNNSTFSELLIVFTQFFYL